MAESKTAGAGTAEVHTPHPTGSSHITMDAPPAPAADPATPTPESLGVTQAQFDKFYSADTGYNWENHAKELAFKLEGKAPPAEGEETPAEGEPPAEETPAPAEGEAPASEADATNAVAQAGLDFEQVNETIATTGALSEEHLVALRKIGIPDEVSQGYVKYLKGTAEAHVASVTEYMGGDDGLAKAREWAKANLPLAEIQDYEKRISDPETWRLAADSILARAGLPAGQKADPIVPPNAQQAPTTPGGIQPYATQADMIADQRKPEYRKDPAFHQQVMDRARISTFKENPRLHSL